MGIILKPMQCQKSTRWFLPRLMQYRHQIWMSQTSSSTLDRLTDTSIRYYEVGSLAECKTYLLCHWMIQVTEIRCVLCKFDFAKQVVRIQWQTKQMNDWKRTISQWREYEIQYWSVYVCMCVCGGNSPTFCIKWNKNSPVETLRTAVHYSKLVCFTKGVTGDW